MYVYGKRVIKELLSNNKKILKAYVWNKFDDKNIILELEKRNINIKYVLKQELSKIAKGNHQGIIVNVVDYYFPPFDHIIENIKTMSLIVILDHLQDTHNFGAIIRTCEVAGVDAVIIPKNRSVKINPGVMKTSSGALDNILLCKVANINNIIKTLKDRGFWIIGADDSAGVLYTKIKYDMPVVLVIGNEKQGMSKLTKKLCDIVVSIPVKGQIGSLNASVAAGILIYKILEYSGK